MSISVLGYLILLPLLPIILLLAAGFVLLCLLYVVGLSVFVNLGLSEYLELPDPLRGASTIAAGLLAPFASLLVLISGGVPTFSFALSTLTLVPVVTSAATSLFFIVLHRIRRTATGR